MTKPDFSNVQGGSSSTAPGGAKREESTRTYVVVAGDSLSKIAQRLYGNAQDWRRIFDLNRDIITDPDLIHPGQTLRLP